ncbi:hypothetical protein QYE76_009117 [Lolium multiflorum]|uniref:Uncharacterized protein n=1 Tax=Lolium multiflorum TaxID=4521 RepID=A0AAD8X1Q9_LOLMU|nr:hypothetical protein QYE76_009117 [Lolium multiflorum]
MLDVAVDDVRRLYARLQAEYQEETSIARGVEEQLDMKTDNGREAGHGAGHEDISWSREGGAGGMRERRRRRPGRSKTVTLRPASPVPGRLTGRQPDGNRKNRKVAKFPVADRLTDATADPENKSAADISTWREYEALRNEMRREFRAQDDVLSGKIEEISQKLDATHVTVTTMQDQMTDVQCSLVDLRLAVENLTVQQQQEDDEDPELQDDAHNARDAPRGNRPRGWAPLGRNGRGQDEEDGLGKPKFSIPKFEGGADVEEYLTWELKIEKLWSLHPHYY